MTRGRLAAVGVGIFALGAALGAWLKPARIIEVPGPVVEVKQAAKAEAPVAAATSGTQQSDQRAQAGVRLKRKRITHPDGRVEDHETLDCSGAARAALTEAEATALTAAPSAGAEQAVRVTPPPPVPAPKLDVPGIGIAAGGGFTSDRDAVAALQVRGHLWGGVSAIVQAQKTFRGTGPLDGLGAVFLLEISR